MINQKTDLDRRRFVELAASSFLRVSAGSSLGFGAGEVLAESDGLTPRSKPAKQLIYLFMAGGMSHIDTFD